MAATRSISRIGLSYLLWNLTLLSTLYFYPAVHNLFTDGYCVLCRQCSIDGQCVHFHTVTFVILVCLGLPPNIQGTLPFCFFQ
jgi:predicted metal-binding protein